MSTEELWAELGIDIAAVARDMDRGLAILARWRWDGEQWVKNPQ